MRTRRSALIALSAALSIEATASTDTTSANSRISLRDGQNLTGKIRSALDSAQPLQAIDTRDTLTIPRSAVGAIRPVDTADADSLTHVNAKVVAIDSGDSSKLHSGRALDPNYSRGLLLPNGFMLQQGQCVFVQNELIFSQFGFGVTDHFSVGAGSVLPLFLSNNPNVIFGVKFGGSIGNLHAALGWNGLAFQGQGFHGADGVPYGAISLGNNEGNISLSYWHLGVAGPSEESGSLFSAAGYVHPLRHAAFLFELWRIQLPDESPILWFAPGIRLMSGGFSGDLALVLFKGAEDVLPWVNIAYAF